MKRSLKCIALLLALALAVPLLCSCAEDRDYPPALTPNPATPPPAEEGGVATFEAALYFVSEDGRKLYSEEHTLTYGAGVSRAEAAIKGLIAGPQSALLRRSLPEGLYLEHVELSLDVCNVYFTGEFPQETRAWLTARAAIAATVNAVEEIGSVNVFYNGVEPGYVGRPLGTLSPVSAALDVYLQNMEQDYEVIPNQTQGEVVAYETHAATLYFTDVSRTFLAAKTMDLTYGVNASAADIVQLIFDRLRAGDSGANSLEPVLPPNIRIVGTPQIYTFGEGARLGTQQIQATPDGGKDANPVPTPSFDVPPIPQEEDSARILDLVLNYGAENAGFDETLMCAALTMTFTSYLPNLDGVRISVEQEGGALRVLCETYFERTDFRAIIGHGVTLYYPDEEGMTLIATTRIVPSASAYDPQLRLEELLLGPADPGVLYMGFSAQDVLSVYISGNMALVNWQPGFAQKLREAVSGADTPIPAARRELMFVYGVVNTLTDLPFVQRVWMRENGQKLSTIQDVYLGNPLVRSPGLISEG